MNLGYKSMLKILGNKFYILLILYVIFKYIYTKKSEHFFVLFFISNFYYSLIFNKLIIKTTHCGKNIFKFQKIN